MNEDEIEYITNGFDDRCVLESNEKMFDTGCNVSSIYSGIKLIQELNYIFDEI